jgi:hypothetical protein
MIIDFGEHIGMSVEAVVLKEPGYIKWVFSLENPKGRMVQVKSEAQRLIPIFDAIPYQKACCACMKPATRCTVYRDNIYVPYWWCDECDPYQSAPDGGKLTIIRTYEEAVDHCGIYCSGKTPLQQLVKTMAQAKGLPKRVGEKQAQAFFAK